MAKSSGATPLTAKLANFVALSADELGALDDLLSTTRLTRHNREIIAQGRGYDSLLVLMQGIAIRYRVLRDGRRQILSVALPGDMIGFPTSFFETALYSVTAVTDSVLAAIPFATLVSLIEQRPRLAAAIFWSFSSEAAIYAEHLVGIGRRSALERVAHFLLELLTRFQMIGLADERSYPMPLTQELLGDALGLSVPYVNRTLRQLRDDDLATIEEHRVIIKDVEALSALADFDPSYLTRFRMLESFADTDDAGTEAR